MFHILLMSLKLYISLLYFHKKLVKSLLATNFMIDLQSIVNRAGKVNHTESFTCVMNFEVLYYIFLLYVIEIINNMQDKIESKHISLLSAW